MIVAEPPGPLTRRLLEEVRGVAMPEGQARRRRVDLRTVARGATNLGFGRIVASEVEVPILLVNLV